MDNFLICLESLHSLINKIRNKEIVCIISKIFIVSYYCYYGCCAGSVIFLILTAAVIALKFVMIFAKPEEPKDFSENFGSESECEEVK